LSLRAARFAQPGCPRCPDHVVPAPAAQLVVLARSLFRAARLPGCPCRLEVLPCTVVPVAPTPAAPNFVLARAAARLVIVVQAHAAARLVVDLIRSVLPCLVILAGCALKIGI
jgi:hypothetical protein